MKGLFRLSAVVAVLGLLGPAAQAAPPLSFTNHVSFGGVVPSFANPCSFAVHHAREGAARYTLHERRPGSGLWGFTRHEQYAETYTNVATGVAVQARVLRAGNSVWDTEPALNPDGSITFVDAFHGLYLHDRLIGGGTFDRPLSGSWGAYFTVDPETGALLGKGFTTVPNGFTGWLGIPPEVCAEIG